MELTDFFRSFIERVDTPVVFCDLEYRIIYLNNSAAEHYAKFGGRDLVGRSLLRYIGLEAQSKVDMVVEWFKESVENNSVFAYHNKELNSDVYICALRNDAGELIGFSSRQRLRSPETREPYETN